MNYRFLLIFSLVVCSTIHVFGQEVEYDIIIQNGIVFDGSGHEPQAVEIGIIDDQIVTIDQKITGDSKQYINANGLAVAPGFIDMHAHIEAITLYPECESVLRQGVTTVLGGPDGGSPLPIGKFLNELEGIGVGANVAYLVGHNTVRNHVMGLENRAPTYRELLDMQNIIIQSMDDGAFGISTGLKYIPGAYTEIDEVIALSKSAAEKGGIYTSHLREEGLELIAGVQEAINISAAAKIPVVLTHHKAIGKPMWGASKLTLALVDSARQAGLDIMMDQYPYTASFTNIGVLIPAWSMAGDKYKKFAERCEDPILRDSIKKGIVFNLRYDRGGDDLHNVQIARFDWKPHLIGKTLYDWALEEGMEPTAENGAELVIQAQSKGGASCIYHVMSEEDVERIMQHPMTMHASDGRLSKIGQGHPHPRAFGTFPRVLGVYVREKKVLTLQEAIRKMTSLPADRLGLNDRGLLKVGNIADIVIFNPETIIDKGTFIDPNQFPVGIEYVIVNGKISIEKGDFKNEMNGVILRKKQ